MHVLPGAARRARRPRRSGGQVLRATHSPLLTALPGATVLQLGERGIEQVEWQDLDLVDHGRRCFADPAPTCGTSSASEAQRPASGRNPRRRRLFVTTNTELNAIAAPASIGLSSPAAASGIAATL